jgi:serine/threonine protein kinase
MGHVFRAIHVPSRQPVAIKVFRRGQVARHSEEEQRRAESDMLRRLRHENVVRLFDDDAGAGDGYLVMELIDGQNLTELVRQDGPLPVEIACEVIRQAAVGLQHMHDCGLVHRDVKPTNLMLDHDGVVKIIDLGLTLAGRPKWHEASAFQAGTLEYMAPEQFRDSDRIDGRADIYSLGCTLYYLLTGGHFLKCNRSAMGRRLVKRGRSLALAVPGLPGWLVRLFNQMVGERPVDRPATMSAVAARLPALHARDVLPQSNDEDHEEADVPVLAAVGIPSTESAAA